MLFELRQYKLLPGHRDEFVEIMESEIIPMQVAAGMVILGSFLAEDDAETYVWIRRFKDEEERVATYAAVYESERWKDEIMPRIRPMLAPNGVTVRRMLPTPKSPIQ